MQRSYLPGHTEKGKRSMNTNEHAVTAMNDVSCDLSKITPDPCRASTAREQLLLKVASILLAAERHVAEGERIVARQRQILATMKTRGLCTTDAVSTIQVFLRSLDDFKRDRQSVLNALACQPD
jgi:hypothetical protein